MAKILIRNFQFKSSPAINLRNSRSRKSNQHLYSGINKYRRLEHRIIKLPSPTILNQRKVMKMNTYFPSQMSLAINHQKLCQRLEINSTGTNSLTKKIKQPVKNYSTICTSKILAQTKSESRIKLLSHPRKNLDTTKTKKSRHQQPISLHHPYLQHSIKKSSPSMSTKSGPPRAKTKQARKQYIDVTKKI